MNWILLHILVKCFSEHFINVNFSTYFMDMFFCYSRKKRINDIFSYF